MEITFGSRQAFMKWVPPAPYALISFRDPLTEFLIPPNQGAMCSVRADYVCHDASCSTIGLVAPTRAMAVSIIEFFRHIPPEVNILYIQCEAGVGRSTAVAAALLRWHNIPYWKSLLERGTYNRKLFSDLCSEVGFSPLEEPKIGIAMRLKYPMDRFQAAFLSLQRQRYQNWTCVAVSDGEGMIDDQYWYDLKGHEKERFDLLLTDEEKGLWGHPYRQLGIDKCLELGCEWIGLGNDDNYYTPGYMEQMMWEAEKEDSDLVLCKMLHSYSGWDVVDNEPVAGCADVSNWLAKAELIKQVPFTDTDFLADGRFVEQLAVKAKHIAKVNKPLLVKN